MGKAKRGAIVIRSQQQDVFNLSSYELKKLVQGVVWRDEHFDGMALKEIAKREGCSEGYVGRVIFRSFETLQKGFPVQPDNLPVSRI